jgi:hypothetical protein
METILKAIIIQRFRFVTLTRLARKTNLLQTRLLVRRVCEDELKESESAYLSACYRWQGVDSNGAANRLLDHSVPGW